MYYTTHRLYKNMSRTFFHLPLHNNSRLSSNMLLYLISIIYFFSKLTKTFFSRNCKLLETWFIWIFCDTLCIHTWLRSPNVTIYIAHTTNVEHRHLIYMHVTACYNTWTGSHVGSSFCFQSWWINGLYAFFKRDFIWLKYFCVFILLEEPVIKFLFHFLFIYD